ncbi:hypothetical protein KIPB_016551, partial [Kipferlia bialata]
ELKGCGISSYPDIHVVETRVVDVLIFGCDGLWDVCKTNEIPEMIRGPVERGALPHEIAAHIANEALI